MPRPHFSRTFFSRPTVTVARALLGAVLETRVGGVLTSGMIVETEAYHETEPASHSSRGKTPRTEIMFGPAGFCYVYFIYGVHYCVNVVTETPGTGAAVLIRALEPIAGIETMERRRGVTGHGVTNGPGKLCEALAIDRRMLGEDFLNSAKIRLRPYRRIGREQVLASRRIGITKAVDLEWRFSVAGNPWVSGAARGGRKRGG